MVAGHLAVEDDLSVEARLAGAGRLEEAPSAEVDLQPVHSAAEQEASPDHAARVRSAEVPLPDPAAVHSAEAAPSGARVECVRPA